MARSTSKPKRPPADAGAGRGDSGLAPEMAEYQIGTDTLAPQFRQFAAVEAGQHDGTAEKAAEAIERRADRTSATSSRRPSALMTRWTWRPPSRTFSTRYRYSYGPIFLKLGLTLVEAKQLLAHVQQEVVAAQIRHQAIFRPDCQCAGCGCGETGVSWPSRCRSTPELDRLKAKNAQRGSKIRKGMHVFKGKHNRGAKGVASRKLWHAQRFEVVDGGKLCLRDGQRPQFESGHILAGQMLCFASAPSRRLAEPAKSM